MSRLDLSVFVNLIDKVTSPLKKGEKEIAEATDRLNKRLKLSLKIGGIGAATTAVSLAAKNMTSTFTDSIRELSRAQGELQTLGVQNIDAITKKGQEMQTKLAGVTSAAFVRASYDIKSGISSLSDEGVAEMTAAALTVAKATKGVPEQMTSLFATSHGIFKKQFADMSDGQFGEMFGAALSKSVQQFKTDGAKMQQAIQSAGAGAANLGVSLTDQLTLLGMMQQQMEAGEAGTALRAFATNAAKAETQFAKLAKSSKNPVRVKILDNNGQLRAMPDILSDLKARYGDTLDAFEASEIKQAFGTDEAMKMINALYGQEEAVRANAKALNDAAAKGAEFTNAMAKAADKNFDSAMVLMSQRLDVLWQKIGEQLAPALIKVSDYIKVVTDKLTAWADANPTLIKGIGSLVVGIGSIAAVVGPLLIGLAGVKAAMAGVQFAFLAISSPIAIAIAGIVAVAGAAYLIYEHWEPIEGFFRRLGEGIKAGISWAWEGIKTIFFNYTPIGLIYTHWDGITNYFARLLEGVKSGASWAWEGIKNIFFNYTPIGLIYTHWGSITNYFAGLWEGIKSGISIGWEAIKALFFNYHPLGILYSNWDGVVAYYGGLWEEVKLKFQEKWEAIKTIASTWGSDFLNLGGDIIAGLKAGISAGAEAVYQKITSIGSDLLGKFKSILGINSPSKEFSDCGGFLVDGLMNGLNAKIKAVKDTITGIGASVVGWFKDKLGIKSPSRVFKGLGSHLSEGLALGITDGERGVMASMAGLQRRVAVPFAPIEMGAAKLAAQTLAVTGSLTAASMPAAASGLQVGAQAPLQNGTTQGGIHYSPQIQINLSQDAQGGLNRDVLKALIEEALAAGQEAAMRDFRRALHD